MTLWASVVGEIHVLLAALVLFIVLPMLALPRVRSGPSVLVVGMSFWIIVVGTLAYFSLVRYALLFLVALIAIFVARRLRPREAPSEENDKKQGGLWDGFEQPKTALSRQFHEGRRRVKEGFLALLLDYGWAGLALMVAALLWALIVGSWPWLHQADPGTPGGYANLLRIASMTSNAGVYASGTAPLGLAALGATMATAFFLPAMDVLRFLYPLADMFTVVAVGSLAHQITRSPRITAITMFITSASTIAYVGFPINFESPIMVHWALVLVLAGLAEAIAWVKTSEVWHAGVSGVAFLAGVLMSPPEALIGLAIACVVVVGTTRNARMVIGGVLAVLGLGSIPLWLGILGGHPLSPDGWLIATFSLLPPMWRDPSSPSYLVVWFGVALALVRFWHPGDPVRRYLAWAIGGMALVAGGLGWIPMVATTFLWSDLLGLLVLVAGVDLLVEAILDRVHAHWVLAVGAAFLAILMPSTPAVLARYEPVFAGRATLHIEEAFPPYQWTVISPGHQYSEVLGRGWHEELATFTTTYTLKEAQNPRFSLAQDKRHPILSPDVFLYVEPVIYPFGPAVTKKDLLLPIGPPGGNQGTQSFLAEEARAYFWARAYHRSHPKTSQFSVQSRHLMVLWIRQ